MMCGHYNTQGWVNIEPDLSVELTYYAFDLFLSILAIAN